MGILYYVLKEDMLCQLKCVICVCKGFIDYKQDIGWLCMGGHLKLAKLCRVLYCVIIALVIHALDSRFRNIICHVFREILFYCNIYMML